jgi:predicted AAA+ superfamily ATPase
MSELILQLEAFSPYLSLYFALSIASNVNISRTSPYFTDRILAELSIYLGVEIRPEIDLVVFDEIQESNPALTSLKYFAEKKAHIHLAAAGSLLGIKMSDPGSFPVGKVNFLRLYPMTFVEFLDAMGETQYRSLLENVNSHEPLSEAFHSHFIDLLRYYYFVGGMPEAVKHFAKNGDGFETREIQKEIVSSYKHKKPKFKILCITVQTSPTRANEFTQF